MMPLAPTSTELPAAHRPKIGFSIDSIVGGGGSKSHLSSHRSRSESLTPPSPEPSSTEISAKTGSPRESSFHNLHNHLHHHHLLNNNNSVTAANNNHRPDSNGSTGSMSPSAHRVNGSRETSMNISNNTNGNNRSASVNSNTSASTTPPIQSKSPLVFPPSHVPQNDMHHHSPAGHPGLPPHFAAYHFAAAAAAAAQNHHPGLPWMQPHPPPHHPHHPASSHPLYPWLLAKHSRMFPHRFGPGNCYFFSHQYTVPTN